MNEPTTEQILAYFEDVRADDELEIDESLSGLGNTSRGGASGTWVRAWVWCYNTDVQAWLDAKNSNIDPT